MDEVEKMSAFMKDKLSEMVTFMVNQPIWDFLDVAVRVGTHAARKENAEEKQDQLHGLDNCNDGSDGKGRGRGRGHSRGRGSGRTDDGREKANINTDFLRRIECCHCGIEGRLMKECRELKRGQRQQRAANASDMTRAEAAPEVEDIH